MSVQTHFEVCSDSDLAPLTFHREFSAAEIQAIAGAVEMVKGSAAAGNRITRLTLEPDPLATTSTLEREGHTLLVTQEIIVCADSITLKVSSPQYDVAFQTQPFQLDDLLAATLSPDQPNFIGFSDSTGVLRDYLDVVFDDADDLCPGSDLYLTETQLQIRYQNGEHKAFPRSDWQYEVGNGDASCGYWQWLHGRIQSLDQNDVVDLNARLEQGSNAPSMNF